MPYFLIAVFCIFCWGVGLLTAFFRQSRFLALYLILGSTGAAIFSVLLPIVLVLVVGRLLHGSDYGWLGILALTFGFLGGGAFGGILGLLAAARLNALLGWNKPASPTAIR